MEDSLLEHTNTMLNLLNMATHKGNLSSSHLVQRLEYLKHRLDDFLCPKTSGLSAKSSKPDSVKPQTEDTGVLYECGICNSPITMYNGDHKLSMDLHCQEEVHQRALSKVKDTPASKVEDEPVPEVNDKYVSFVKTVRMYHCSLCNVNISKNEKCVNEHLKGSFHKTNLKKVKEDICSKIPVEWMGHKKYFAKNDDGTLNCKPCAVTFNNVSSELINHLRSKKHTSICVPSPTQEQSKVQDVWSALPKELQPQKLLFQSCQSGALHCKVCGVKVPNSSNTLLDHVRGSKHTKLTNAFMIVNGIENDNRCTLCDVVTTSKSNTINHVVSRGHLQKLQQKQDHVWSSIPEAYREHRKYFITHEGGALRCIVCGINVAQNHIRVLGHIFDKKHQTAHISSSVVDAYRTHVSAST